MARLSDLGRLSVIVPSEPELSSKWCPRDGTEKLEPRSPNTDTSARVPRQREDTILQKHHCEATVTGFRERRGQLGIRPVQQAKDLSPELGRGEN